MKILILFWCIVCCCCIALQGQELSLNERISIFISDKADGRIKKSLTRDNFQISFEEIRIKDGDRIQGLLATNSLSAMDDDIYKLIYELNPTWSKLDFLPADSLIRLPIVELKNGTLKADELISVHLDDKLRQSVLTQFQQLKAAIKRDSENLERKLRDTSNLRNFNESVNLISRMSSSVQGRTAMITRDQLTLLNLAIIKMKTQTDHTSPPLSASDLSSIYTSLTLCASNFSRARGDQIPDSKQVDVTITIKRINDLPIPLHTYRVYYCAPGLEPEGAAPIGVSALQFTYKMDQAEWIFWVKRIPSVSPYPPDCEKIPVLIFKGQNNKVDLIIAK